MFKFPGGEVNVKLDTLNDEKKFHLKNSDEILQMLLFAEAYNFIKGDYSLKAVIPYVPYARQDRRCNNGEALSIKVMSSLINSCKFKEVEIYDPHSDVVGALIDRVKIKDVSEIFKNVLNWKDKVVVAPDAGATKKVENLGKILLSKDFIQGIKKREISTGKLSGFKVLDPEKIEGAEIVIVDDICDGGGTFIGLGNEIRKYNPKKLELVVTHGIFSQGLDKLQEVFNTIYTTNSWNENLEGSDFLKVIKV